MSEHMRIAGIAGSLRRASINRGLIRAARELAPEGVSIDILELDEIPLYNADLDPHYNTELGEHGEPESVRNLKERIGVSDALLIATPEYNYSIPGVLKNAIDWASRPPSSSVLRHKPVAIMGAAGGTFGTVRAQLALRQVFVFTDSPVLSKPEVIIPGARALFDDAGNLTDERTKERVRDQLTALISWTRRLRAD